MISKRYLLMPMILALALVSFSPAFAQQTTNVMTIGGTCGVTLGSSMNFSTVEIGIESAEQQLDITGLGSVPSELNIYATNWVENGQTVNIIDGQLTKFSFTAGQGYDTQMTPLNSTDGVVPMENDITNGDTVTSYWKIKPTLNPISFSGLVEQTMTIATACVVV